MQHAPDALPDNIDALKSMLVDQAAQAELLAHQNTQLQRENERIKAQVLTLQEQLNLAIAKRYAASSEKISPDQIHLFNEAEAEAGTEADTAAVAEAKFVTLVEHTRPPRGRKALPEALPRIDVIHELPAAERRCPHDGAVLTEISSVISEQLDIVPATIRVLRHRRPPNLE